MKTNIRMSEHLMRQSSGELPVLQSQLIKHNNVSVKISSGEVLNYYCKIILIFILNDSKINLFFLLQDLIEFTNKQILN